MRIGIIAPSGHQTGLGHFERQLAFAAYASRRGHKVHVATTSDPGHERTLTSHIALLRLRDVDPTSDPHLLTMLHAVDRLVVDLPDDQVAAWGSIVEERADVVALTPGTAIAVRVPVVVRIGGDLDRFRTEHTLRLGTAQIRILSGRAYVLLREAFREPATDYARRDADRILVTHGGSDPWHLSERTLSLLEASQWTYTVDLVVGPAFGPNRAIERQAAASKHRVHLHIGADVADLMRRATLAIVNGGTTRFELCRTGTPFMTISASGAQRSANEAFEALAGTPSIGHMNDVQPMDLARPLDRLMTDASKRQALHERMTTLFDTHGVERLLQLVTHPTSVGNGEGGP